MKNAIMRLMFAVLWMFFVPAGCAAPQPVISIESAQGETTLKIDADNFRFVPNNIRVYQGDTVLFKVENISNTEHNLTVKDPEGCIISDQDISPKGSALIRVVFSETGVYDFYCNEPFHNTLGMSGQIEVLKRR